MLFRNRGQKKTPQNICLEPICLKEGEIFEPDEDGNDDGKNILII